MKPGRPRLEINQQLILSLRAKGWGYRRIAKAYAEKVGYISPSTVRNIIKAWGNAIDNGQDRLADDAQYESGNQR